ncbi:hypothetical protein [Gallaecimonas mangrovi]|uniref:hypothetical protein n=1 Tax=Gallaecimonas mangrovi TaxID=2291597 RepID=UPI000E205BB5|nr:hypothetical protein [Gallaecimonas mangrovi]
MKIKLILCLLLSPLAMAQEPLSHFEEVCVGQQQSQRCRDYLVGVVDGVIMQNQSNSSTKSGFVDRAKSQRIGVRLDYLHSRLCETPDPDKNQLLAELKTEIKDAGIQSEQDLLNYLNKAFSCQ